MSHLNSLVLLVVENVEGDVDVALLNLDRVGLRSRHQSQEERVLDSTHRGIRRLLRGRRLTRRLLLLRLLLLSRRELRLQLLSGLLRLLLLLLRRCCDSAQRRLLLLLRLLELLLQLLLRRQLREQAQVLRQAGHQARKHHASCTVRRNK